MHPIPDSDRLLSSVKEVLALAGPQTLIIGVDGRAGAGKSATATWLAWQLNLPIVALEFFMIAGSDPVDWRYEDLGRALATMAGRAIIVEGACLCQVLQDLDRDPGYLIWVENKGGREHGPEEPTDDYITAFDPAGNADFKLTWTEAELQEAPG